jgi:hypothetical protein
MAVPVFGLDPSPSASSSPSESASPEASASPSPTARPTPAPAAASPKPAATAEPSKPPKPEKSAKPENESKTPGVPITIRGVVGVVNDGKWPEYTLTSGGTVYELSAGPPWWWLDKNPLAASVGKTVTIVGEQEGGTTEIDVESVDGTLLRESGRPPWAGGWKSVGPKHPGWAQWKVDKLNGKGPGSAGAPGDLRPPDAG